MADVQPAETAEEEAEQPLEEEEAGDGAALPAEELVEADKQADSQAEAEAEAEAEPEADPFERLSEESDEDEEQANKYKEYLELVKDIDVQNGRILDLKQRALKLRYKNCRSSKENREYLRLCVEQEQESIKLNQMIHRAMLLQNFGSARLYGDVELAITELEEDTFIDGAIDKSACFPMTTAPTNLSSLNCRNSDDEQSEGC